MSTDSGHAQISPCFDWIVRSVCRGTVNWEIPVELRHNLMIQECSHYSMRCLSDNMDDPYGLPSEADFYPLMLHLEQKFDDVEQALEPAISPVNRFRLYAARLYLENMYFVYDSPSDLRKSGVMKAFFTARRLISIIISDDSSNNILAHSSLVTVRMIFTAAAVLFRVFHSSYSADLDHESVRILFNAAAFSMHQLSVQQKEKDLPTLAAEAMREMWKRGESSTEMLGKPLTLMVKSRMGASILHDTLNMVRKALRSGSRCLKPYDAPVRSLENERSAQPLKESTENDSTISVSNLQAVPSPQWTGMQDGFLESGSSSALMDLSWLDDLVPNMFDR